MPNDTFRTAIVRKPGSNFARGLTTFKGPPPIYEKTLQQHDDYCTALERCGLQVVRLSPDLVYPDSTFVEDTAVLTHDFAVITRPGAQSRMGEVDSIRGSLMRFFHEIREIKDPGTVDGGDVCQVEGHFFIGMSQRTNEEGARQLGRLLAERGYTSSLIDIRPIKDILHLKSEMAWLGEDKLAVSQALAGFRDFCKYELIFVEAEESYAANCVRVNENVLIPAGFPKFAAALARLGQKPVPVEISEFRKMDGGLSCLSLRF